MTRDITRSPESRKKPEFRKFISTFVFGAKKFRAEMEVFKFGFLSDFFRISNFEFQDWPALLRSSF